MVSEERESLENLRKSLERVVAYDKPEIYNRGDWGMRISFDNFKNDFERVFSLARIFADLPFKLLPDNEINQIRESVENAANHFQMIDEFDATTANNAQQTVTDLGNQVSEHADNITREMAQWISYLAYQKGDVTKNIEHLETTIGTAENIIEQAKTRIEEKESKINKIIQQAQDFAGDRGVTVFTQQFDKTATQNKEEAGNWLIATITAFSITIIVLVTIMFWATGDLLIYEWLSRAALVGILITVTIWCGKTYRILRHQHDINSQKANGLRSFLSFREAADNDESTRNAVLLETTRAIFSVQESGFIAPNKNNQSSDVRLIDTTFSRLGPATDKAEQSVDD